MPRPTAMGWGSVDRGTHRQAIELRNHLNSQADPVQRRGKQHRTYRSRRGTNGSAESENPGMCGSSLRGNRETRQEPCPEANGSRAASMKERTRRIDAETSRESDGGILPEKQPNKANPEAAEVVEGRPPAKRNTGEKAIK